LPSAPLPPPPPSPSPFPRPATIRARGIEKDPICAPISNTVSPAPTSPENRVTSASDHSPYLIETVREGETWRGGETQLRENT
jgi:hypothetical protein